MARTRRAADLPAVAPDRETVALLVGMAEFIASRMTRAGHVAMVLHREHQGSCSTRLGCTDTCIAARDFLARVADIAEAYMAQQERHGQPEQPSLFGDRPRDEVAG